MEAIQPIRPEILAAKVEKIRNFEYPELLEQLSQEPELVRAMWFLQFVSQPENYAGGLGRFTADFIAAQSNQIGSAHMAKANPRGGQYIPSDAIEILRELPYESRREIFGSDDAKLIDSVFDPCDDDDDCDRARESARPRADRKKRATALLVEGLTVKAARKICAQKAEEGLARYLKRLCEVPHVAFRNPCPVEYDHSTDYADRLKPEGAPWYFQNVADALLAFISARSLRIKARIANTEITQLVTRWVEKSRRTKESVMIIGNSRFGKTEAVKMNAESDPGTCRLVQTPDSTAIGDLLREVARVLGIDVALHSSVRELREKIEYVLRFSGLQLIFDESQMLLPGKFSRNTAPARLNWVRRMMMDRQISVVFVCTPQSYLPAKKRFVNATGFAMEQFDERILKTVELPRELSEQDLLAVARIHFSNLREEYLKFVVDQVISTERNFVSDIRKIAVLAYDNAQEAGHKVPMLADIEAAMAEVLPTTRGPEADGQRARNVRPCSPLATPMQKPRKRSEPLRIPSRETQPVMMIDA
jgi:hypothetical protein